MAAKWKKADKDRCRSIVIHIASHNGGMAGLATKLGLTSRATPSAWASRGQVPTDQIAPLLKLKPPELLATPSMLNPDARDMADLEKSIP